MHRTPAEAPGPFDLRVATYGCDRASGRRARVSIVQEAGLFVGRRGVRSGSPARPTRRSATLDTDDVEREQVEGRFNGTVQAVPGLLVFGTSVDEVLERVRSAIEFRGGTGRVQLSVELHLAPVLAGMNQGMRHAPPD